MTGPQNKEFHGKCATGPHRVERLEPRTLLSTVAWIGAYGGAWTTAADWSTGAVPKSTDDVVINVTGSVTITLNGAASVNSLSITGDTLGISGGNLTIAATLANSGTISLDSGAQLTAGGAFTQSAGAKLTLASASKTNCSFSAASISNGGTISIGAGDSVSLN